MCVVGTSSGADIRVRPVCALPTVFAHWLIMPSVCGEDCTLQKCPLCVSEPDRDTVVDLVMHRTMADVDPDTESVDDMLITIPKCGHVFTVETLDGIVLITEYYDRDALGIWCGLRTPPAGFLKPPTCPTCRAAITCPRSSGKAQV